MKKELILCILIYTVYSQYSVQKCKCNELLSEYDCRESNCQWDSQKSICQIQTFPSISSGTPQETYCDQYINGTCQSKFPCAFLDGKCTYFTGCTAYARIKDDECKAISNRCISNGTHCINIDDCNNYSIQKTCNVNAQGGQCFWDSDTNTCTDVNTCEQFSLKNSTDEGCRKLMKTCTTNGIDGCIESGLNCSNQQSEKQCVWNKEKSVKCYWNHYTLACVDYICDNAPKQYISDDDCKSFISTCTTKKEGGCITRSTCAAVDIQAACTKNILNEKCIWNGTNCVDYLCENANQELKTNEDCSNYKQGCITKSGGGCIQNGDCFIANTQSACVQNINGFDCIWNTVCQEKTCINAPLSNNTHQLCEIYLQSCTVNNQKNGCTTKNCENAPLNLKSSFECENYLPGAFCITSINGGCKTKSTCQSIETFDDCKIDSKGNFCFWDNTYCKDKICSNAPALYNNYTDEKTCYNFFNNCTVNSSMNGCVDRICQNIQQSNNCTLDLRGQPCIWKPQCYQKYCSLAPKTYKTFHECQDYLQSCTVSNSGQGCVSIPLVCSAIKTETGCYSKKIINPITKLVEYPLNSCGWNGLQCIDYGCTTLPMFYTTTAQCEQAYPGHQCVSANPINGMVKGCMDLPSTCYTRLIQDNCEINPNNREKPQCIWNMNLPSPSCVEKTCETASAIGTLDYLTTFSNKNCDQYLPGLCIINKQENGCQQKTNSCANLVQIQCQKYSRIAGECYWNGFACYDKICQNIIETNHTQCQNILDSCTVRVDGMGCQDLFSDCSNYQNQNQCFITSDKMNCKWTGLKCINSSCSDAPDNSFYSSNQNCLQNWLVNSEQCTVIYKIGGKGCVQRLSNCSLYTSQAQCYKTIDQQDCLWANGICYTMSYFQNSDCSQLYGTQSTCQTYRTGCSNTPQANSTTPCIFDCNQMNVSDYSLSYKLCQQFDSTCSVNQNGRSCITRQFECSQYSDQDQCVYSARGMCIWNSNYQICTLITTSSDCQYINGTSLTHNICNKFSSYCTASIDGTHCQEYYSLCVNYQQNQCSQSQEGLCIWFNPGWGQWCKIVENQSECSFINRQGLTHEICQQYNNSCTLSKDQNTCQQFMNYCSYYQESECTLSIYNGLCIWNSNLGLCKTVEDDYECSLIQGIGLTHDICQSYNTKCTNIIDGSVCQLYQSDCSNYSETGCTQSSTPAICFWSQSESRCIQVNDPTIDCYRITTFGSLTFEQCQIYNKNCSINRDSTYCVKKEQQCSDYSTQMLNCVQISKTQFCISSNQSNDFCIPAQQATTCEQVFLGNGNYNTTNCNRFKYGCIVNYDMTGCVTKNCTNFIGIYTHGNCNSWIKTCTVNAMGTNCITMANLCTQQDKSNCVHSLEGECIVFNSVCVKKTCDSIQNIDSFLTDEQCSNYLNICTVARIGGCQSRQNCNLYRSQIQCQSNISGSKCFWNPTLMNCVDLNCFNIEQSYLFDTHFECNNADYELQCTVRAQNGNIIPGCRPLGECNAYLAEEQCSINNNNEFCEWNINFDPPICQIKSCLTAAQNLYVNHIQCQAYLNNCTVYINNQNGLNIHQGCMPLTYCHQYISQDQCYIDAQGNICGWNGLVCDYKSCFTAPLNQDYSTHQQCFQYLFNKCTVSPTGQGCIKLSSCEQYTSQLQCVINDNNQLCYWNQSENICITRKCENAPIVINESSSCNFYLNNCTMSNQKCRNQICEDYEFSTDDECQKAMSSCTTDGQNCVKRGTCQEAQSEAGCTVAVDGTLCAWIQTSKNAYCTNRNCQTAPIFLITEEECQFYFNNCTTKYGGGCTSKSTCDVANTLNACTTALDGTICSWDNYLCRNRNCQDYQGSTHKVCNAINQQCTVGLNGHCAIIQNCEDTKIKTACIYGINGPCLWVDGYLNKDGSLGACFQYSSCNSLSWTTDSQCKLISQNCTTDGNKCIGITSCIETNINGGCVTGYDGLCALNSNKCTPFHSCSDFHFQSHSQCQNVNLKCTSDGITCIELQDHCSKYGNQFYSCIKNNKGKTKNDQGLINSTGICTWVTSTQTCRDQNCNDLLGISHQECNSKLFSCTFDGEYCIPIQTCQLYLQQKTCQSAIGSDGTCFWDFKLQSCRLMVCEDIQNGKVSEVCKQTLSICITDGKKCISKENCSAYKNQITCHQGGSDGTCVYFTNIDGIAQCKKMSSCNSADGDKYACDQVFDRCQWSYSTKLCNPYTCESYYTLKGICSNFLQWDQQTQQICILNNNQCIKVDPTQLNQKQCLKFTQYTYTWSQTVNKCLICNSNQTVTKIDAQNNTTKSQTSSGYIIFIHFFQILLLN